MKRKMIWILPLILVMAGLVMGCSDDSGGGTTTRHVTGVSVDSELTLVVGGVLQADGITTLHETDKLSVTFTPANPTNKNVTFESDDEDVAEVDADGWVTAVGIGYATITVTTADGGYTAECLVTVLRAGSLIPVTGVTLNQNTMNLTIGGASLKLTPKITPSTAYNRDVTWMTDDEDIATVDENGYVTGVGVGQTTITVITDDGNFTDTCDVTVVEGVWAGDYAPFDGTGYTLVQDFVTTASSGGTLGIAGGVINNSTANPPTRALTIGYTGSTGVFENVITSRGIVVTGSNYTLLFPSGHQITANDEYLVEVVFKAARSVAGNDLEDDLVVFLADRGTSGLQRDLSARKVIGSDEPGEVFITSGVEVSQIIPLTATGTAANTYGGAGTRANYNELVFRSTGARSGTTGNNALGGTLTLTFTTFKVWQKQAVAESITLDKPVLNIELDQAPQTLTALVAPSNANDKRVTWSSDDTTVARVSNAGVVTPVGIGTATITAALTSDGDISDTCTVNVYDHSAVVSEVNVKQPWTYMMEIGETKQITYTMVPANAKNQTVTWFSDDPEVATVDENGLVTAISEGDVTIYAQANDKSGEIGWCDLTVVEPWIPDTYVPFEGTGYTLLADFVATTLPPGAAGGVANNSTANPPTRVLTLGNAWEYGDGFELTIDAAGPRVGTGGSNYTWLFPTSHKITAGDEYVLDMVFTTGRDLEEEMVVGLVDQHRDAGGVSESYWNELSDAESLGSPIAIKAGVPVQQVVTLIATATATVAVPANHGYNNNDTTGTISNTIVFSTGGEPDPGNLPMIDNGRPNNHGVQGPTTMTFTTFKVWKKNP